MPQLCKEEDRKCFFNLSGHMLVKQKSGIYYGMDKKKTNKQLMEKCCHKRNKIEGYLHWWQLTDMYLLDIEDNKPLKLSLPGQRDTNLSWCVLRW